MQKLENIITKIFMVMAAFLFAALSYYSFFYSYVESNFPGEVLSNSKDILITHILALAIMGVLLMTLAYLEERLNDKICRRLLYVVMIVSTVFTFYWISCRHWMPDADQYNVSLVANMVREQNYTSFHGVAYACNLQNQWGMIYFLELLYGIFPKLDYYALIYLNALMVPVIIYSGYYIIEKIFPENKTSKVLYLAMTILCFPIYGYVTFVYGEILYTAIAMFASVLVIQMTDKFSIWKMLLLSVLLGLAVQIRMNTLIYVIAIVLVFGILAITRKNWRLLLATAVILIGVWAGNQVVRARYEPYLEEGAEEMPYLLYIAMGLHDPTDEEAGWYDSSHVTVFIWECGRNQELAIEAGREDIESRMEIFKENPSYSIDFFRRKFTSQWNNPTYQMFGMNQKNYEASEGIVKIFFSDSGRNAVGAFMNEYQLVVYVGVLCFLLFDILGKNRLESSVLLVTIFGGFLFSMMWEAKARYIFPYFVFMLPYAADGLAKLGMWFYCHTKDKRHKVSGKA